MKKSVKNIGLALGGGGVRGLAHAVALDALDNHDITPSVIAGTSMGAIIGAIYASGRSGKDIRHLIEQHMITKTDRIKSVYAKKDFLFAWFEAVKLSWNSSGMFKADGFLRHLIDQLQVTEFEDLKIPLHVVATDFHSGEPVIINSGPLLPALKASICIPGVFEPVVYQDRVLFDGGVSNNLPYDILQAECKTTIAVDVSPTRNKKTDELPNMIEATIAMFDTLMERLTQIKLAKNPPTLYFHPDIYNIRMLEFHKAEEVFSLAEAYLPEMINMLKQLDR